MIVLAKQRTTELLCRQEEANLIEKEETVKLIISINEISINIS